MRDVCVINSHVPGSSSSRLQMRNEIRALTTSLGIPSSNQLEIEDEVIAGKQLLQQLLQWPKPTVGAQNIISRENAHSGYTK